MDSLLRCSYDVGESKRIGAWTERRNCAPRIDGGDKEANMSEETAREIAEREIGRADDKRKTPERRAYRSGDGRRRKSVSKAPKQAPEGASNPIPPRSPAGASANQRRLNRV
jgi:hypothetical protein